jgi:hypothetical protein
MLRQLGPGQTWDGVHFSASGDAAEAEGATTLLLQASN